MEYRGKHYAIVQGIDPHLWKWTVTWTKKASFAEQNVGLGNQRAKGGLPLEQRRFAHIVTVEIEQIEGVQHEFLRFATQLILQHGEIRHTIGRGHQDPSDRRRRARGDAGLYHPNWPR